MKGKFVGWIRYVLSLCVPRRSNKSALSCAIRCIRRRRTGCSINSGNGPDSQPGRFRRVDFFRIGFCAGWMSLIMMPHISQTGHRGA